MFCFLRTRRRGFISNEMIPELFASRPSFSFLPSFSVSRTFNFFLAFSGGNAESRDRTNDMKSI